MLFMFGIFDELYAFKKSLMKRKIIPYNSEPIVLGESKDKSVWFYFINSAQIKYGILRKNLFLENRRIEYYIADISMLFKEDANETKILLEDLFRGACNNIESKIREGYKINLLGISLGNIFTIRAASIYPCQKLISISGGSRLGRSSWDGLLTRELASKSGLSQEDYEKTLSNFDPYQYVKDVKAKEIFIYLGGADKIIRSEHGIELLDEFK